MLLSGCQALLPGSSNSQPPTPISSDRSTDDSDGEDSRSFDNYLSSAINQVTGQDSKKKKAEKTFSNAELLYHRAILLRDSGDTEKTSVAFTIAAKEFQTAAGQWQESSLEEDSLFRAGESLFFADAYSDANHTFELLVERYPNTRYHDIIQTRRFAIARYWLHFYSVEPHPWYHINWLDETRPFSDLHGNAMRIFARIPLDDPTGRLADDAILAQANSKFVSRRYDEADQLYADLRTMYPTSEHQFSAHLMGIKTKLLRYQGPQYDGDALDEAQQLVKQIRTQFPQESADDQQILNRSEREIRYRKAEREWSMAKFYDRRRSYGAARFYYQLLAEDYGDTPYADKASNRISEIRDRPAVPKQKMKWLVKMFPDSSPELPVLSRGNNLRR